MAADIEQTLAQCLSRCRDVSLRDGHQCHDANRWRIQDKLPILRLFNDLSCLVQAQGFELPPIEAYGGADWAVSSEFLGEDPLDNLQQIVAALPDLPCQDLYRGRNAYGYRPVTVEVQAEILSWCLARGLTVHRVFDMMNDLDNQRTAIDIMKALRAKQVEQKVPKEKRVVCEAAVCYISEPIDSDIKVWPIEKLVDHFLALIKLGESDDHNPELQCVERLVLKCYAGLITEDTVKVLFPALKVELLAAKERGEISVIPTVSLHTHGDKAQLLNCALAHDVDVVDTAIGLLSGHPSHSNLNALLNLLMKQHGFELADYEHTSLYQKINDIESLINRTAQKYLLHRKQTASPEQVTTARMAGGAVAAMTKEIERSYSAYCNVWSRNKVPEHKWPSKDDMMVLALTNCPRVWEYAGRFHTVTPGAKILYEEVLIETAYEVATLHSTLDSKPKMPIQMKTQAYKDLVMGRYGHNSGFDQATLVGNQPMQQLFFIESALKTLVSFVQSKQLAPEQVVQFLQQAGCQSLLSGNQSAFANLKSALLDTDLADKMSNLSLDQLLTHSLQLDWPAELCTALQFSMTPCKFPEEPTQWQAAQTSAQALVNDNVIDTAKLEQASLVITLSQPDVGTTLYRYLQTGHDARGKIEAVPYDDLLETVTSLVELDRIDETARAHNQQLPALPYTSKPQEQWIAQTVTPALHQAGLQDDSTIPIEQTQRGIKACQTYLASMVHSLIEKTTKLSKIGIGIALPAGQYGNLADIVGIEAVRIIDALHDLAADAEAPHTVKEQVRRWHARAKHMIRLVGREARDLREAELRSMLISGRFSDKAIERLQHRLDYLQTLDELAWQRCEHFPEEHTENKPLVAEGQGSLDDRIALLHKKLETQQLDNGDRTDMVQRIEKLVDNDISYRVTLNADSAFLTLLEGGAAILTEQPQTLLSLFQTCLRDKSDIEQDIADYTQTYATTRIRQRTAHDRGNLEEYYALEEKLVSINQDTRHHLLQRGYTDYEILEVEPLFKNTVLEIMRSQKH